LITTGPPIRSAAAFASAAVVQNPYSVTGIPESSTIRRDSYSKNRMSGAGIYRAGFGGVILARCVLGGTGGNRRG